MPDIPQKEFIYVNIPEFRMHVMNGATKVFDMDVIKVKKVIAPLCFQEN